MTDNITKGKEIKNTNFQNELNNSGNNTNVRYEDDDENKNFLVNFRDTNHEYIVDRNGKITLKGTNVIEDAPPVVLSSIKSWASNANTDFHKENIRNTITEIEFVDYIPNPVNLDDSNCWDVSENGDKSIISWLDGTKLYIGGNGGVKANADSSYLFYNFPNLENINFSNNYDTSDATNMACMFANSMKLQNLDLSGFNTSKVTDMAGMFMGATGTANNWETQTNMLLNNVNLSSFDTSKVTSMSSMFGNCGNLITLDLSNFDTGNVTSMSDMFNMPNNGTSKLEIINFGEKWNTQKVTSMSCMFESCVKLKILDLSSFDTSNVINMGYMFNSAGDYAFSLRTIYATDKFVTDNVTEYTYMFDDCNNLVGGNGTKRSSNNKIYARIDKNRSTRLFYGQETKYRK